MCGRFALATEKHLLEMLFKLELRPNLTFQPRYNIAPAQKVPVVRLALAEGDRELVEMKWGLVPFWAKDTSIGNRMINARAETVPAKPSFRDAYKKRRLLVPASGFFEWKNEEGFKQPYYITDREHDLFALAGLWERWDKGPEPLETFTILTTEPNALIAKLHNRMPVIIAPRDYADWLNPETDSDSLQKLFQPYPEDNITCFPVSRLVNNPANDSPELLNPIIKNS
jgi:putative SOS response-associated peptidase YedK